MEEKEAITIIKKIQKIQKDMNYNDILMKEIEEINLEEENDEEGGE